MELVKELRKNLYLVELSQKEVNEIEPYADLEEIGAEIWAGENVLERDTLWFIYSNINRLNHYTPVLLNLKNKLKEHLIGNSKEN